MKMHHDVTTPAAGRVAELTTTLGAAVVPGDVLARSKPSKPSMPSMPSRPTADGRPDGADRRRTGGASRPRRDRAAAPSRPGRRRARRPWPGVGPSVVAPPARTSPISSTTGRSSSTDRSSSPPSAAGAELDDLIANTPADGLVGRHRHRQRRRSSPGQAARCVAMSYDYTVLAGTQGLQNHRKKDRLFDLAERLRLPIVFFTEGGGGRPGDTDGIGPSGLDCLAFLWWAELSGLVPLVGVNAGYCFAGNAAILGCCDVVIATADSNIGMGGPAMIEGGGLGIVAPTAVGPIDVQRANGVVDLVAADEAEARRAGQALPVVLPGVRRRLDVRRPATAARRRARRPAAQLRRAARRRPALRHRVRARAAAGLRPRA